MLSICLIDSFDRISNETGIPRSTLITSVLILLEKNLDHKKKDFSSLFFSNIDSVGCHPKSSNEN